MNFNDYQREALEFKSYPEHSKLRYLLAGIVSELGELATLEAKHIRGDEAYARSTVAEATVFHDKLEKELGDLLWFIAMWAHEHDLPLQGVAIRNLAKLRSRKERGVINGDGDDR